MKVFREMEAMARCEVAAHGHAKVRGDGFYRHWKMEVKVGGGLCMAGCGYMSVDMGGVEKWV